MTNRQALYYNAKATRLGFPVFVWETYTKWVWALTNPGSWPSNYYRFPGDNTSEGWEADVNSGWKLIFKNPIQPIALKKEEKIK